MIVRKWQTLDGTKPNIKNENRISQAEAEELKQILQKKDWGQRAQYGGQINKIRERLHRHKQATINVTKAGHEYENFVMDQGRKKHQVVQMEDRNGEIQKGNAATAALAEQMEHKFKSKYPGPLGGGRYGEEHEWRREVIRETAMTEDSREEAGINLLDQITAEEIVQAIHDMINRKRAGTDEEVIQFYKLIFGIKPPGNSECWTNLERSYQQRMATLEPQRQQTVAHFLQDMNAYVQTLASAHWKHTEELQNQMDLKGLKELHEDMHMGDIVPLTKMVSQKQQLEHGGQSCA